MNLSIQEASSRLGLTPSTLRYYDKEGLLPGLKKLKSGTRIFSEKDLQWLGLICCLKNSGMSIADIKNFMNLCLQGESTCEERKEVLERHKKNIYKQIENLQNSLSTVDYKIENYKEIGIFHID